MCSTLSKSELFTASLSILEEGKSVFNLCEQRKVLPLGTSDATRGWGVDCENDFQLKGKQEKNLVYSRGNCYMLPHTWKGMGYYRVRCSACSQRVA